MSAAIEIPSLPEVSEFVSTIEANNAPIELATELAPELQSVLGKINSLTGTWNPVEIYTPTPESFEKEKAKFFEAFNNNREYQPRFEYGRAQKIADAGLPTAKLSQLAKDVRRFDTNGEMPQRIARVGVYAKIRDDLATCMLVEGIVSGDENKIGAAMKQKYAPPSDELVDVAEQMYERMTRGETLFEQPKRAEPLLTAEQIQLIEETQLDAEEIKGAFEWMLEAYGILRSETQPDGFSVVIDESTKYIDVRDKSTEPMTVFIPADRVDSAKKIAVLTAHEIEGHARQSTNGAKLFGIGGGGLKMDGEALYEGLAMRLEGSVGQEYFGDEASVQHPWFVLGIRDAFDGLSFAEVFNTQYERQLRVETQTPIDQDIDNTLGIDSELQEKIMEQAWKFTYRVMRGHADMSNPEGFAMAKDTAYLQGWMQDKKLGEVGYGWVNELAVIQRGGLQLLARLGVKQSDIPHPLQEGMFGRFIDEYLLPLCEEKRQNTDL